MKQFNLEKALAGEPVKLRKGSKAYVLAKIPDNLKYDEGKEVPYPLIGIIMDKDGYIADSHMCWTLKGGCYFTNEPLHNDIVEMWEEPFKLEDLPKSFKPKEGEIYYYIHPHETNFYLDIHETTASNCRFDEILSNSGNCFRTKKDAQKWIDFMKSMKE